MLVFIVIVMMFIVILFGIMIIEYIKDIIAHK